MRPALVASILGGMMSLAGAAQAASGFVAAPVTVRAGPGALYPALHDLSPDARIWIHGCRSDLDWCDISHGRLRGWVQADRLVLNNGARLAADDSARDVGVATFNRDQYWADNYQRYAFYKNPDAWRETAPAGTQQEARADTR